VITENTHRERVKLMEHEHRIRYLKGILRTLNIKLKKLKQNETYVKNSLNIEKNDIYTLKLRIIEIRNEITELNEIRNHLDTDINENSRYALSYEQLLINYKKKLNILYTERINIKNDIKSLNHDLEGAHLRFTELTTNYEQSILTHKTNEINNALLDKEIFDLQSIVEIELDNINNYHTLLVEEKDRCNELEDIIFSQKEYTAL
jgi:chromosome segregation ATPase